jgi:DNA primase
MTGPKHGPVLSTVERLVPGLRAGAGTNWLGFCPLHGEVVGKSKPSFSFNEATGQWHCFAGCGGGGLPQLLKRLNKPASWIDRTVARLQPYLQDTPRKKLSSTKEEGLFRTSYPLPEKLLGLYEYAPLQLLEAGFSEAVLKDNDVGFDPSLGRITYPIRDLYGTLAGIVGKPTERNGPGKYVVYQKEIEDLKFRGYTFSNHDYLWRWEKVYPQVYGSENPEIVCIAEGFKAALWLVQAGFPLTVALMGTSMSEVQTRFLHRLGTKTVLCLDDDHWGRIGTKKAGYKLRGVDVRVMRYPYPHYDLQPDDLTLDELREAVHQSNTYTQWRRNHGA